eukprot:3512304-Prymnesium_polylepis.1
MLLACCVVRTSGGSVQFVAHASAAPPRGSGAPSDGVSALEVELQTAVKQLAQTAGQPATRCLYAVERGEQLVVALFFGVYGFACLTPRGTSRGAHAHVAVGFLSDVCARWDA